MLFFVGASFAQSGNLIGKIFDQNGIPLPGANISLEGTNYYTMSNLDGEFKLIDIEDGIYTMKISFVGYTSVEKQVEIKGSSALYEEARMQISTESLEEVYINSTSNDQSKSLANQRASTNITNIVSADQAGKFPDTNIGESVRRISGITIQNDQGEARNIIIRGVSPALNNVQLNGERIPSAEGDNRNIQMDLIPADMIQSIEVSKTITPDMQADAIGGTVNLVTRASNEGQRFSLTGGSGVSNFNNEPIWNGSAIYGNRFFKDKLGVIASGSYQNIDYGSDNVEFEWDYDGDAEGEDEYIAEQQIRQYFVQRIRKSVSATIDYRFNASNSVYFKGIYNNRNDFENRYRLVYKDMGLPENGRTEAEVERQTKGGSPDNDNRRLEDQRMWNMQLGGNHVLGKLEIDWKASRSLASEERPNERYIQYASDENVPVALDLRDISFANVNPLDNSQTVGSNMELDELSEEYQQTDEKNWVGRLDFTQTLSQGSTASVLKFGGRFTDKTKQRSNNYFEYENTAGAFDNMSMLNASELADETRDGFYPGSKYVAGSFPTSTFLGDLDLNNSNSFDEEDKPSEYLPSNYEANESIYAAYAMIDKKLSNKLSFIAGLRYENTQVDYQGYRYNDDTDEATPTIGENDYDNLMPSVHFRFAPRKNSVLRLAWSNTLARPNYYDLVPYENIIPEDLEVEFGNSDLKATTSMNFDLMYEKYFDLLGVVSGGVFLKNIDDFIYTSSFDTQLTVDGQTDTYEATKPINGADAQIYGAEIALQRSLNFIPGKFFKYINVFTNYTYTHSSANGIEGRDNGQQLEGTAKHMFNASLAYDNNKFQIRASLNYASDYVDEFGKEAFFDRYYDEQLFLDVNLNFLVAKNVNVFASATNLTNQELRYYQGQRANTMQMEYYGPRINFGLKWNVF